MKTKYKPRAFSTRFKKINKLSLNELNFCLSNHSNPVFLIKDLEQDESIYLKENEYVLTHEYEDKNLILSNPDLKEMMKKTSYHILVSLNAFETFNFKKEYKQENKIEESYFFDLWSLLYFLNKTPKQQKEKKKYFHDDVFFTCDCGVPECADFWYQKMKIKNDKEFILTYCHGDKVYQFSIKLKDLISKLIDLYLKQFKILFKQELDILKKYRKEFNQYLKQDNYDTTYLYKSILNEKSLNEILNKFKLENIDEEYGFYLNRLNYSYIEYEHFEQCKDARVRGILNNLISIHELNESFLKLFNSKIFIKHFPLTNKFKLFE